MSVCIIMTHETHIIENTYLIILQKMISIEYLRQFRVFEYAIFDFAAAFLGVYLLAPLLSKLFLKLRIDIPKTSWIYLTMPIAIISHVLVGNITPLTRDFINTGDHYTLKIVIIILLILGLKDMKLVRKVQ